MIHFNRGRKRQDEFFTGLRQLRNNSDPRITSDRVPPKWFMDELVGYDDKLAVHWWNVSPGYEKPNVPIGPTFELVRLVQGMEVHVMWFKLANWEFLRYLKACDWHRLGIENYNKACYRNARKHYLEKEAERAEKMAVNADEFLMAVDRYKDILYSHSRR